MSISTTPWCSAGRWLVTYGEPAGENAALDEAIAYYRELLEAYSRTRAPLDWAATQNNLAIALERLGDRESGIQHLTEAVAAYRAALEERTSPRVPLAWAGIQNNLGNALRELGNRRASDK